MSLTNRTLIVLQYLWTNTDEQHPASLSDISKYLAYFEISADPRTLRKDIDQLIELGVDIVKDRKVQNLYHVATRHFDTPELKLLIDAVQSSRFITPKKSKELIEKLSAFVGPYQNKVIQRELYVDKRSKADNESIYLTVDRIQSVIAEKKKIVFQYFDYAPDKSKILRHEGQIYTVSPYALIWYNDTYYMIGYHDKRKLVAKFRVDRITGLEMLEVPAVKKPKDFDVSEYFTQEFTMLDGIACEVELICENELMGNIIDRFGDKVCTEIVDVGHFKVTITVDLSNNFYGWIFASAGKIHIKAPKDAIDGFNNLISCWKQHI